MATAIQFAYPMPNRQLTNAGRAGGSASYMRLVATTVECAPNGCEVVLGSSDYAEFQQLLQEPPQVIPGLAALLRQRRQHR